VWEDSASRLCVHETIGWKPVVHDRQDACPPSWRLTPRTMPSVCSFRLFGSTFGVRCSMFDVRILQSSVFSSSVFFTRQKTASLQDTRRKTREPSASLGKREHRTSNAEHPTSNRREKANAFCLFLSPLLFDVRCCILDVQCGEGRVLLMSLAILAALIRTPPHERSRGGSHAALPALNFLASRRRTATNLFALT
jgi:hypothetical protein